MPLDNKEIENVLMRKLVLDCPILEIIPDSPSSNRKPYKGSGYLSLNDIDNFEVKLFPASQIPPQEFIDRMNEQLNWPAGQIIDRDFFYGLSAVDTAGRQWNAKRILPKIPSFTEAMIVGNTRNLVSQEPRKDKSANNLLKIVYATRINFPRNTWVKNERQADGDFTEPQHKVITRFLASNIQFDIEFREDLGCTILLAKSSMVNFDRVLINRIMEAFSFVTGSIHPASLIETHQEEKIETTLLAEKVVLNPSIFGPPVEIKFQNNAVLELFEKYLFYVIKSTTKIGDSIGNLVRNVIASEISTIDVEALTLSVSVEALLTKHFKSLFQENTQLDKDIVRAIELINTASDLNQASQTRFAGAINSVRNIRAMDYLIKLQQMDLIEERFIKDYKNLRNPLAHGMGVDPDKIQSHLNKCGSVLVLFYQLIFLRIGYKGPYADYSKYGHPSADFRKNWGPGFDLKHESA